MSVLINILVEDSDEEHSSSESTDSDTNLDPALESLEREVIEYAIKNRNRLIEEKPLLGSDGESLCQTDYYDESSDSLSDDLSDDYPVYYSDSSEEETEMLYCNEQIESSEESEIESM